MCATRVSLEMSGNITYKGPSVGN